MESNKIVYTSFSKLAVAIAVSQGATLEQAKEIIIKSFERHPFYKEVSKIIKK